VSDHHEKRKHRSWDLVNPNAPEYRPFQVGTSRDEFERLVAIAIALGVPPAKTGRQPGQSSYVVAMIRMIARGQLVVAHPAAEEPEM